MNTIAERIYDFLKHYPPFEFLSRPQLFSVCEAVEVIYLEKGDTLFEIAQPVAEHFYVVRNGAIGLFREADALVDECDEGDIFGLRALMRKDQYILEARAIEESIVYSISSSLLSDYITTNTKASQFLLSTFVSNSSQVPKSQEGDGLTSDYSDLQSVDYCKNPIVCDGQTSIKEAASKMSEHRVGSIVIVEEKRPVGIITDKDLRTQIATGLHDITENVSAIMSSPVITFPEAISVAEAQVAMLRNRITHLCITKDGTDASELTGILSEHDIVVLRENNASSLIKEVKRVTTVEDLRQIRQRAHQLMTQYLEQEIPIDFVARIISAINDAVTHKLIDMAIAASDRPPPVAFAWLTIGSQGRQEQLLFTDQDNALVFADVSAEAYEKTKAYFLALADTINKGLEVVGFELCPAEMMANNPKWCLSLTEWQQQFKRWITTPDQDNLMLCTIFFDYESTYGDAQLVDALSEHIFESIASHDIFLNFLGRNALQNPPPLGFFRQFLVENDGEHKDQFDLKARALMPLIDAARLLILYHNLKSVNNTTERYEKLAQLEPQNKDTYHFCAESFQMLLRFRTEQGLLNNDSGRFIKLGSLSKGDKLKLRRCFKAVKAIQELIQTRFKLAQLM